ncbi:fumarylacetoacetate hydrolase family protein [Rhodococcus sp. MEB032]|uniref:fumarylacetoacetate hydrolase family protein n=1 Tax=Rhodococcus sp. MEB032 TaxID=3040322 RepID=UPI00254BEBCB|nr:fumarylacetoacetate hydrolase family protein [Rhodococcus sp. MEB032]
MRIAQINGRAAMIIRADEYVDIATATGGRFPSDIASLYAHWDELNAWASETDCVGSVFDSSMLECPVSGARQIFAIGLNYADHAREAGVVPPSEPAVFTKFQTSLADPLGVVVLPDGNVDWEAELVVVIGVGGRNISTERAWDHVAGLAVGQDLSERRLQKIGALPQFSLAKSHAGFSPVGPYLVTPDELPNPDDLAIGCSLNGEDVQKSRTSQLVFPVATLLSKLSAVVELLPGDVIFTGTPAGVGTVMTPPRFLKPGDMLTTYVEGIGEISQTFVSAEGL